MPLVTLNDLHTARQRLEPVVSRTSLLRAPWASCRHRSLFLKPENLQITGSFKIRGAYNRLSRMSESQKTRGVIARSSGNHGKALAYAARQDGVKATIVMPSTAAKVKIDGVREYGADVRFASPEECPALTEQLAAEHGYVIVPPSTTWTSSRARERSASTYPTKRWLQDSTSARCWCPSAEAD